MEEKELKEEPQEVESNEHPKRSRFVSFVMGVFEFIKTVAFIVVIAFIIRIFAIQPFIVEGQSMEPSFANNDYLITEKISYKIHEPSRGDIIIFRPPDNPSVNYIKRIIGLPGDTIEVKNGSVYVNGERLVESYLTSNLETKNVKQSTTPFTVQSGEYYVMGDNREHSRDSREVGAIPKQNITSRIWFRLLPPNSIKVFARVKYETVP